MSRPPSCPRCSSTEIYRSHRMMFEHLLIGFRAFRCNSCKGRFRVFDVRKMLRRPASASSTFSTFGG